MEPGATIPINPTLGKVDNGGSVPLCHLFMEISLGNVLSEVGSDIFPSMQDDHLDQSEGTKMRVLLQDSMLRSKSGEVGCRDEPGID